MERTLRELAELVGGELIGDGDIKIRGVAGIKEAKPGEITFILRPRYLDYLSTTKASALIAGKDVEGIDKPHIRAENPHYALAQILELYSPERKVSKGIHSTVIMGENVELGRDVSIQAYTVIGDEVKIGDRVIIHSHVFLGDGVRIGKETLIYPQVVIRERVSIGEKVIIHSGTVIGSDGFGYVKVGEIHHKIPQIGTVVIEDDVEIGANVTIDRATMGATVIKRGTKIDNLVQIAHNVVIGENSIIVAQVGISGSTELGRNVTLAGQVGLIDHISIGDNVIVGGQAGVMKSIPANEVVWGSPAKPIAREKRIQAILEKLPELYKNIKELERKIEELGRKLER